MGKLIRCISDDGLVAVSVIDSTDIAAAAEQYHKTSAVVTAALGRLLTAASLMGVQLKGADQTVTVRISGDGPIGSMTAVSDANGCVRGYAANNNVELPLNKVGKLDVGGAVGRGDLFVTKDLRMKEPYNGAVRLVSGEIAEDIAAYFARSEQIPTVCALGVLVNPDLTVKCAGGYLIQLLPAAGEAEIEKVERCIASIPSVTDMMQKGMTPLEIAQRVMSEFQIELLDESVARYKCGCSKKKTERVLCSLGREELMSMAEDENGVQVQCNFCNKCYSFTQKELETLAESAK